MHKSMVSEEIQTIVDRREESKRRQKLFKILKLIADGEFDASKIPFDLLYQAHSGPRQEYISPKDRDTYNSGYMEVSEMMSSSPNVR